MNENKSVKYYLFDEVVTHNKKNDFWVIIHKNVLDLTPLLKDRRDSWNRKLDYLLAFGGKDISHYFMLNGEPKVELTVTGTQRVLFPPILEVAISDMCKSFNVLWSQDPFYFIGRLTRRARRLRIVNTRTSFTQNMIVCDEDTIYDIQRKYTKRYNYHAGSYIWLRYPTTSSNFEKLCFNKTLDENGLIDDEYCDIELPPPSIWLFYTDDLTEA